MAAFELEGKVAVVAGATRGAGRGIACMLGEAGATVYCTGRSIRGHPSPIGRPETIEETAERVKAFSDKNGSVPGLAVILVGSDPASQVYVRSKAKACEAIGMKSWVHYLEASTNFEELSSLISKLNDSEEVNGILVQLPLPNHLDERKVLECIDPKKDPDGLTLKNIGALWADHS